MSIESDPNAYASMLESIGDAVIALDAEGKILVWNRAAEQLYGWTKAEVLGHSLSGILITEYDDPLATTAGAMEEVLRTGMWQGKVNQTCKDGSIITIDSSVRLFGDPAAPVHGLIAVNRDISDKEKMRLTITRLEYLNRVLLRLPSLDEVFRTYVGQIGEILTVDRVELWLIQDNAEELQVARRYRHLEDDRPVDITCLIRETPLAIVRLTREPLIIPDLHARSNFTQRKPLEENDRALMLLPVMRNSDVVGAISFTSRRPNSFQQADADRLITSTEQFSLALIQIQLVESLKNKVDENAALLRSTQKESRRRQELSRTLIRLQERERAQLSREFHDEIGQSLTAMYLNMRAVQTDCDSQKPELISALNDSLQIASRLMEQVRTISLDLHPKILDDLGFIPALRWLINRAGKLSKAQIHFEPPVNYVPMAREIEFAVFRIAQEALTNVLRHANPRNIHLRLDQNGAQTSLTLVDDGIGFEAEIHSTAQLPANVFGLLSMFARADLIGAELHVTSKPGQGTTVKVVCSHDREA